MSTREDKRSPESEDGPDLRTRFIRSAIEILAEPETPLDLRKVAERAGKSRTAPYLVFGKERDGGGLAALRLAVAAEGTRMLCARLERARSRAADALAAFHGMAETFLDFASDQPRLYRLMFGPEIGAAAGVSHTAEETANEIAQLLQARAELEGLSLSIIRESHEAGLIPPGETLRVSRITWATLHGLALLRMDGQLGLAGIEHATPAMVDLASEAVLGAPTDTIEGVALTLLKAKASKDAGLPSPPKQRELDLWEVPGSIPALQHRAEAPSRSPLTSRSIGGTRALRRAARSSRTFRGAKILWIDDHPEWNEWERRTLEQLGAEIEVHENTESALTRLRENRFDLIVSDIARGDEQDAGVRDLPQVREASQGTPVVFYVGVTDEELGVPEGAWGVTNRPEELLHLVMDVLERSRG